MFFGPQDRRKRIPTCSRAPSFNVMAGGPKRAKESHHPHTLTSENMYDLQAFEGSPCAPHSVSAKTFGPDGFMTLIPGHSGWCLPARARFEGVPGEKLMFIFPSSHHFPSTKEGPATGYHTQPRGMSCGHGEDGSGLPGAHDKEPESRRELGTEERDREPRGRREGIVEQKGRR